MLTSAEILNNAIEKYNPKYVIAMFSGGHDSLVATHVAAQHPRFSFALHINTGIGVDETRKFVRETCKDWNIELREYKASEYKGENLQLDPQIYEDIVKKYGFPGVAQHDKMYIRLKERPLRMALRELDRDRKEKTLLVTGVRKNESIRRMRHVKKIQVWEGTKIFVAPLYNFEKSDVEDYIDTHQLKRNLVVAYLHMSGECLCGAYAHEEEKEEIRIFFPEIASYLDNLEIQVAESGFPWKWEESPPKWFTEWKNGQDFIEGFEPNQMLCNSCRNFQGK